VKFQSVRLFPRWLFSASPSRSAPVNNVHMYFNFKQEVMSKNWYRVNSFSIHSNNPLQEECIVSWFSVMNLLPPNKFGLAWWTCSHPTSLVWHDEPAPTLQVWFGVMNLLPPYKFGLAWWTCSHPTLQKGLPRIPGQGARAAGPQPPCGGIFPANCSGPLPGKFRPSPEICGLLNKNFRGSLYISGRFLNLHCAYPGTLHPVPGIFQVLLETRTI
jgi:hypothetical protein